MLDANLFLLLGGLEIVGMHSVGPIYKTLPDSTNREGLIDVEGYFYINASLINESQLMPRGQCYFAHFGGNLTCPLDLYPKTVAPPRRGLA